RARREERGERVAVGEIARVPVGLPGRRRLPGPPAEARGRVRHRGRLELVRHLAGDDVDGSHGDAALVLVVAVGVAREAGGALAGEAEVRLVLGDVVVADG